MGVGYRVHHNEWQWTDGEVQYGYQWTAERFLFRRHGTMPVAIHWQHSCYKRRNNLLPFIVLCTVVDSTLSKPHRSGSRHNMCLQWWTVEAVSAGRSRCHCRPSPPARRSPGASGSSGQCGWTGCRSYPRACKRRKAMTKVFRGERMLLDWVQKVLAWKKLHC